MQKLKGAVALMLLAGLLAGCSQLHLFSGDDAVYMDGQPIEQGEQRQNPFDVAASTHYRDSLDPDRRRLYDALCYAYQTGSRQIELKGSFDPQTVEEVLYLLKGDRPELSTSTVQLQTFVTHHWEMTRITLPQVELDNVEKNRQALERAQEVVDQMPPLPTERDKAQYLYEYLCRQATYRTSNDMQQGDQVFTAYGVLVEGVAQCDGFASAAMMLMNLAGLDSYKVFYNGSDMGRPDGHVWNLVSLDGRPTYIDASTGAQASAMLGQALRENGLENLSPISYGAFAMTDEEAFANHTLSPIIKPLIPACTDASLKAPCYDVLAEAGEGESELADRIVQIADDKAGQTRQIALKTASHAQLEALIQGDAGHSGLLSKVLDRIGNAKAAYWVEDPNDRHTLLILISYA